MGDVYESVMELAKRRGFIWPTAECYGSVAGFIDYGPLGAMMKRRIENIWRDFFVIQEGYYEIESPVIGPEQVFIASGHVKGFVDKMFQCPHCREYFRADHAAEGAGIKNAAHMERSELEGALARTPCPACGTILGEVGIFDFNLMFQTGIGPGIQRRGYLRPETAQGMFTNFSRLLRFYRDRLPFGAVQIGKSFRNEISPRQGVIRLREFTQAEAEIFVHPAGKARHPYFYRYAEYRVPLLTIEHQIENMEPEAVAMDEAVKKGLVAHEYVAYYLALTHEILVRVGLSPEKIRFRQHMPDERAHYATDCWDVEFLSERFGWVEVVGIADRTDYDLKAHASESGTSFSVFLPLENPIRVKRRCLVPRMKLLGPLFKGKAKEIAEKIERMEPAEGEITLEIAGERIRIPPELYEIREEEVEVRGQEVIPHVVEPSYGIDRMLYAVLEHSYAEEVVEGETRRVLRLPPWVSPVQVAVLPLMPRDGLDEIAREIHGRLTLKKIVAEYDENGAIGRRYRRQDEIGTPFAITVDYETKDTGTVTLRERDSMKQVRIPLEGLEDLLDLLIKGEKMFSQLRS
ncbi:MAG: glycine--tRNA ligase [Methanomicrobiales archaeon]|nr:glycine--tRNA ligase [Methanomicrobiales archaeon]